MLEQIPVALVTGGSRGIGKEITKLIFSKGYHVCFTYRSDEISANALAAELVHKSTNGNRAEAFQCDMTDLKAVGALVKEIRSKFGTINVLINNAGVLGETKPFLFANDDRWFETLNANVKCVTNTCKRVLPLMISNKSGRIINVTSIAGRMGNPGQSAYAASKAAIVAFSKSLFREVSSMGILINCVSPGLVETDMTKSLNEKYVAEVINTPLARMACPKEVANLVVYMATTAPEYMLGQELVLDGGLGV